MRIAGKEINDSCLECGEMLQCDLFKQGHGIRCERENVTKMLRCQIKREEERRKK